MPMTPDEIDALARKRANAKLLWWLHAAAYVTVNGFFFLSSVWGFRSRPFHWGPLVGWGIGLALHGISVFVLGQGSSLREALVRRERARIEREQSRR